MTIYYIDLNAGDDAKDGLSTGNAWKTIAKFTAAARTAGDIGKVRANTTQAVAATITTTTNGTNVAPIILKGCDLADDPWGDASAVRPIIDFQATTRYHTADKAYWRYENLEFYNSTFSTYAVLYITALGNKVVNCKFRTCARGIYSWLTHTLEILNCVFESCTTGIYWAGSMRYLYPIKGCTFDNCGYGIIDRRAGGASDLKLIDCDFGQTNPNTTTDIYCDTGMPILWARNCKFATGFAYGTSVIENRRHYFEDCEILAVTYSHRSIDNYLIIDKDTAVTRAGGASSTIKTSWGNAGANLSANRLASASLWNPFGLLKVWLEAAVAKTITIYIKGYGWAAFPAASELFLRASYYNNAANTDRADADSTEVLVDNVNFKAFTVTITPALAGLVYLDVLIGKYELAGGINIDHKPGVS